MINPSSLLSNYASTASAGVDVYERVKQVLEKQNTVAPRLNAAITADNTRLSALGQLRSALGAFQGQAQALAGKGAGIGATASKANVLTAQASDKAIAGTHTVDVKQLASSQTLATRAQASSGAAIGTGAASTLRIDIGTLSGNSFSAGKAKAEIVIDAKNNTLDGIAAAVNKAGIGVTATVTQGKDGAILSLSGPSGAAGALRVGVTGDAALQSVLRYDPAGAKSLTVLAEARDAEVVVDGAIHTGRTNTLNDALTGVTLNLKATGTSSVTVSSDVSQVAGNVKKLVEGYNALNARLTELRQGDLNSNTAARDVVRDLQSTLRGFADSGALGLAGLTLKSNGELALDEAKLKAADPNAVAKLLTDGGRGLADRLDAQIGGVVGRSGAIDAETGKLNQDLARLNKQKAGVEQAMLARANALVKLYSQQTSNPVSGILDGIQAPTQGVGTLFDTLG
jgi:flagellar hook-associated protein 2